MNTFKQLLNDNKINRSVAISSTAAIYSFISVDYNDKVGAAQQSSNRAVTNEYWLIGL